MYEPRLYRSIPGDDRFSTMEFSYLETDLWIAYTGNVSEAEVRDFIDERIQSLRAELDHYQHVNRSFYSSLLPLPLDRETTPMIRKMLTAAKRAGVGPMAAVAGAFAEEIGEALAEKLQIHEIIIENGGDLYLNIRNSVLISIHAGKSLLSQKVALQVLPEFSPLGICSSSGTFGHSKSFGKADVVTIACQDSATADAFATAVANKIKTVGDINPVIAETKEVDEILSALVIVGDKMGLQGQLELRLI